MTVALLADAVKRLRVVEGARASSNAAVDLYRGQNTHAHTHTHTYTQTDPPSPPPTHTHTHSLSLSHTHTPTSLSVCVCVTVALLADGEKRLRVVEGTRASSNAAVDLYRGASIFPCP
jgi:hypothetical protein